MNDGTQDARDRAAVTSSVRPGESALDKTATAHRSLRRDGLLMVAIVVDVFLLVTWLPTVPLLWDALSYWRLDLGHLYDSAVTSLVAPQGFRYSPAVAQALAPVGLLPWPVFGALFTAAQVATLVAMGRDRWWMLFLIPPVLIELWVGNIHILLAAAVVFGFRWPALWAFVLLTKVTPGVGVLWFAFRGEWRSLAIALGATASIVALSIALAPGLWLEWAAALRAMSTLPAINGVQYPALIVRLPIALSLLWWAARTDRRWAVPLVVLLSLPSIWSMSYALAAGSFVLHAQDRKATLQPNA